jgi:hypothetical protein
MPLSAAEYVTTNTPTAALVREVDMDQSQVQTLALSLPEVTEEPHFHRRSFRVRGKIFATAIPSDPYLNVLVGESVREATLLQSC